MQGGIRGMRLLGDQQGPRDQRRGTALMTLVWGHLMLLRRQPKMMMI